MSIIPFTERYIFEISYGIAETPNLSWAANKEAKSDKVNIPDLHNGGTIDGLLTALNQIDESRLAGKLLLKIHNNGNLRDLSDVMDGTTCGIQEYLTSLDSFNGADGTANFDWEKRMRFEVQDAIAIVEQLKKGGIDPNVTERLAYNLLRKNEIDPLTGLNTKFGYMLKKIKREKKLLRDNLPEGTKHYFLTADVCSMKIGNQNIGEGNVYLYLTAAATAFRDSLRTSSYEDLSWDEDSIRDKNPKGYRRGEDKSSEKERNHKLSNISDIILPGLKERAINLRPNGSGGDELVASIYTSNDPRSIEVMVERINRNMYKAMCEVQLGVSNR